MLAPAVIASSAVCARMLSILIGIPVCDSFSITGITRDCSSSADTRAAPGRVDSPPISIMSTPSEIISNPRATAFS